MEIRLRTDADLAKCEQLAVAVHASDGYPPRYEDDLAALFTAVPAIAAWVAVDGDAIVGHVALNDRTTSAAMALATAATGLTTSELVVLARLLVAPTAQRLGIGGSLVAVAVADAHVRGRRPLLDVATQLAPAIRLYERLGWVRLGTVTATFRGAEPLDEHVYLGPEA